MFLAADCPRNFLVSYRALPRIIPYSEPYIIWSLHLLKSTQLAPMAVDYSLLSTEVFRAEVTQPGILLVTLQRPKALNTISMAQHLAMDKLWTEFEADPNMRVAILTGEGKVFSAGANLKEMAGAGQDIEKFSEDTKKMLASGGFMGISNRTSAKPIIAALNGHTYGGGTEVLLNVDLAIGIKGCHISLPESRRGIIALAGALPRAGRQLGIKRANELALLSEPIPMETALEWGILNRLVDSAEKVLPEALKMAKSISLSSPDAIAASLRQIRQGYENTKLTLVEATDYGRAIDFEKIMQSPNIVEGLMAFVEKREPQWTPHKL